jgi:thioredoxin-related protein
MGKIYSFLVLAALVVALRAEPAWQTNLEAAKAQAKKENKALLLDFTGSDWCGYCIKLKGAVFDKAEFAKFAEKNLVLVELDYPRSKKLPADVKKQNDKLQTKFNIEGFPTIMVMSADGKELGRLVGYEGDNVTDYIKRLEKFLPKEVKKNSDSPAKS